MELHADKTNLTTLLAVNEQQFVVPPYQRPYAWTQDEVDDLWDDIGTLGAGHFMGSLVMSIEDEQRPQVIDGQQRLTTACLLLAAVRDEYHRLDSKLSARPQNLLVADPFAFGEARFKIRLGEGNWAVFRDFVLRDPDDDERKQWPEIQSLPYESRAGNRALIDNACRISVHLARPDVRPRRDEGADRRGQAADPRLHRLQPADDERLVRVALHARRRQPVRLTTAASASIRV